MNKFFCRTGKTLSKSDLKLTTVHEPSQVDATQKTKIHSYIYNQVVVINRRVCYKFLKVKLIDRYQSVTVNFLNLLYCKYVLSSVTLDPLTFSNSQFSTIKFSMHYPTSGSTSDK